MTRRSVHSPELLLVRISERDDISQETFEIGNDVDPQYPEHWPEEKALPGFRAVRPYTRPLPVGTYFFEPTDHERVPSQMPRPQLEDDGALGYLIGTPSGLFRLRDQGPVQQPATATLPSSKKGRQQKKAFSSH